MNIFLVFVTRWMLTSFWVFGALQQSESKILCDEPENPKIVVYGVNSKNVSLNWKNCRPDDGETIFSYAFKRESVDGGAETVIATRLESEGGFTMEDPFTGKEDYDARHGQELIIRNVEKNEEYVYILEINYRRASGGSPQTSFRVTVDVKVPPEIFDTPEREVQLNINSEKNHTLKCNASGDPHPNITWSKAGVPASKFNASGYLLHLVDVKRKDAGSYICTASNGFGNSTATAIVNIRCTANCKAEKVGISLELPFEQDHSNQESDAFERLESSLLSAIWGAYADNPEKDLYRVDVVEFSNGSVYAIVELLFGSSVSDRLKPLEDEMSDGKLGPYTVNSKLDLNPTTSPPTESTESTTEDTKELPSSGARDDNSGLSEGEFWGIIGGCIAFVIVVVIIIIVCCICRKKSKNGGASKGGKSYSEADGYRMNRQPPPSGLGTASPAYVEARQYAPVTDTRRQDDQSKPPLNYADLSFNSSAPGRQPPPYSGTEYSEMSPEKRPPPAGGQQGEGGGFELWC